MHRNYIGFIGIRGYVVIMGFIGCKGNYRSCRVCCRYVTGTRRGGGGGAWVEGE